MRLAPRSLAAFAAALVALTPAGAASQEIGTAGAVNPATNSTPPQRPTRVLELGARVVFKERVTTTANGTAQLIFLDKTTINIGPNCDLTIDEFVYDPATGTGRMAATLARGVMRFVGGATSHTGGAQVRTPVATIGIRGGVDTIQHQGETNVYHSFGEATVSNGVSTEVLRRPGSATTVTSGLVPVEPPRATSAAELSGLNRQLTSKPGQTGGTRAAVTPAAVQRADGVAPVLAQVESTALPVQAQNSGRTQTSGAALGLAVSPTDATSPTQVVQFAAGVNRQVTTERGQEQAAASSQPMSPGAQGNMENPVAPPPPPARAFALTMSIDPSLGSGAPYLPSGFVAAGSFYNSPVLGYGVGGNNPDGTPNRTSRVLQAGLNITGQGAGQVSTIYVFAGTAFQSLLSGQDTFGGGFTGTTRRSATGNFPGRANSGFVGNGADVAFDANYTPTRFTGRPGTLDSRDGLVGEAAFFFPGSGSTAPNNGNYQFAQTATATGTPAGLGQNRPTANLSGIAAGLMRTLNQTNGTAAAPAFAFEGTFVTTLDAASSRFGTVISGSNATPKAGDTLQNATIPIGFQGAGTQGGRGTYADYNNFGGREARSENDGPFLATVNGQAVNTSRALFVTSDTVNAASFFPNTTFCRCEYTRWGFWSSDTTRTSGGINYQDLLHLGTWVAGQPAAVGSLPTSGVATYAGHAIATIQNGSAQYIAAGNFANAVNFGTGIGTASVTNLDGRNYSGNTQIQANSTQFLGSLSSPGLTMQLQGQFGRGISGPAGEMAGGLRITGTNYLGSGIFAGATP